MDQRHEASLLHALQILRQQPYRDFIRKIYLYGSCARGEQKYHSDLDLLLIVEPSMPNVLIRELKSRVMPDDDTLPEVELKVNKGEELSFSHQFTTNLKKDGVLLWNRT